MSKHSCNCGPGGFAVHGHNWVILERREPPKSCQFKCLTCGWKWWARRKYSEKCPDHVERSRSGLTDQDILDRINEGSLIVNTSIAVVDSLASGRTTRLRIINHRPAGGSPYNFVEICRRGKKKKIALHRLVWMAANRRLVPDGFDVDHINGKGVENADGIENLRLLESIANQTRGYVSPTAQLPFGDDEGDPF